MPQAKVELFDQNLQDCAVLFRALGHPARLAILKFLTETNSCFTGDISSVLPLGRTTVNQHLDELKKSGLIQGHITGTKTNYCIHPARIADLKNMMTRLMDELKIDENFKCK